MGRHTLNIGDTGVLDWIKRRKELGATIHLFLFPDCGNNVDGSHDFPPYTPALWAKMMNASFLLLFLSGVLLL